jgi:hypothetical protein
VHTTESHPIQQSLDINRPVKFVGGAFETRHSSHIDGNIQPVDLRLVVSWNPRTATFILQSKQTSPHAIIHLPTTMMEVETTSTADGSSTRRWQNRSTMRPHEQRNCRGQLRGPDLRDLDQACTGFQSRAATTTSRPPHRKTITRKLRVRRRPSTGVHSVIDIFLILIYAPYRKKKSRYILMSRYIHISDMFYGTKGVDFWPTYQWWIALYDKRKNISKLK